MDLGTVWVQIIRVKKLKINNLPALTNVSNNIQTSGTVVVKNTDNVTFEAGNEIILGTGFEVELGGAFEINMNDCGK